MAQIVEPARCLRPALGEPFLAREPALPGPRGKAQDLDLDVDPLQRARHHVRGDRGDGNRPAAHGPRVVDEQRHHGVAKLGVLLDLERQGRGRVGDHAGEPSGIEDAFLAVELPRPVLLRLQAALKLVGKAADRALERFELLVEILPEPFELGGFGQVLGADLLVMGVVEHRVERIGLRGRRRRGRFGRHLGLGQLGFLARFELGEVVHRDLGFALVLLLVLGLVGLGIHVVGAFRAVVLLLLVLLLVLGFGLRLLLLVLGVGVVAELVAVAQIVDHLAREPGKGGLVGEHLVERFEGRAGLALDEAAPQIEYVARTGRQFTARRGLAHEIARRLGQRRLVGRGHVEIAAPRRFLGDLVVDVRGGARHPPRADSFAAGGFHRFVERARHLARGGETGVGPGVVVFVAQRQRIGHAARQQHLVAGHPPGDLRQAHGLARHAGGIDGIGHVQLAVVGQHLGRFGQRFLERIGGVVGGFCHGREDGGKARQRQGPAPPGRPVQAWPQTASDPGRTACRPRTGSAHPRTEAVVERSRCAVILRTTSHLRRVPCPNFALPL